MPNVGIKNTVPNVGIRTSIANVRVSNFQTTKTGDLSSIPAGTPIGLLLVLTYAESASTGFYGDSRPNVRIKTY